MKNFIALLLVFITFNVTSGKNPYLLPSFGQKKNDLIILRDGTILNAKIQQISQSSVKFTNETSGVKLDELHLSDIYLIKSNKRGNLFFTQDGRRKTGDQIDIDPKATIIYTTDLREIPCFGIEFDIDKIYYLTKPDKKPADSQRIEIPQNLVFLVVYPDGSADIFNDLSKQIAPANGAKEQTSITEDEENSLKVIFHDVKQGETLTKLSERYGIPTSDIREWNEIGVRVKDTTPLKPGQQLMLYVK